MTETQRQTITSAWWTVLDQAPRDTSETFFELGGDSLTAVELMERLESEIEAEFPVDAFFSDGTLDGLLAAYSELTTT